MEKMMIDDFIDYVREQFDCDILVKSSSDPDTFSGVFGASFLEDSSGNEKFENFENSLNYENVSINVQIEVNAGIAMSYNSIGLAA